MFNARLSVCLRFRPDPHPVEARQVAQWVETRMNEAYPKGWDGPDPDLYRRLMDRPGSDKAAINDAFIDMLDTCPGWKTYLDLKGQALDRFNGGRYLPINPQIIRSGA